MLSESKKAALLKQPPARPTTRQLQVLRAAAQAGGALAADDVPYRTGLVLTALSGWWVVWKWTGSQAGALVAGALVAFNEHLLIRLPHTAASHLWGPPLTLYLADQFVEAPTRRTGLLLSLVVAATAATSVYSLALVGVVVAAVLASGLATGRWHASAALAAWAAAGTVG